jgi:hypothetical protein
MDSGLLRWQPFMIWGGGSYVSGGSALRTPAPHDTTFMGPCLLDPEEDISGSPLRHGVQLTTSQPPFINGERFRSPSSPSRGSSSVLSFWHPHGGSSFSSSPSPHHCGELCAVVGPFPRTMGGIPVWLHWLPQAWHLRACCFTLLCHRRITIPLLDLTLPCHFPALVEAYLLLSRTTPRLG